MTNWARTERLALVRLMRETGPNATTLCTGWTTHDLAAHLVVRERQPAAGPGLVIPHLHPITAAFERRMRGLPYDMLLERIEQGPPRWSPQGMSPRIDAAANLQEFFIHHEDVRRLVDPAPRKLPTDEVDSLWRQTHGMSRLVALKQGGLQLVLEPPDRPARAVRGVGRHVIVRGEVGEIVLWMSGRRGVAQVEVTGDGAELADALNL
jgi:uncharacterized protein (TIGR03085 family)